MARINADDVWATGNNGFGVVGIIDTGVRVAHEARVNQYRGNNGIDNLTADQRQIHPRDGGPHLKRYRRPGGAGNTY